MQPFTWFPEVSIESNELQHASFTILSNRNWIDNTQQLEATILKKPKTKSLNDRKITFQFMETILIRGGISQDLVRNH